MIYHVCLFYTSFIAKKFCRWPYTVLYGIHCTMYGKPWNRGKKRRKKNRRWGGGIEFLKTKIKFLKNVKFFWIRVTKVLCVWRGGGEDVCERDDDNILQMRRRREKKNYSLLQNMSEWTTESLKPKNRRAAVLLGEREEFLFRDRICLFMSQSHDDHDLFF
jgi:hypothetical protein